MLVLTQSAVTHHGTQCINNNAQRHQRRDIRVIVGRADLDDFHTAQSFLGDQPDQLQGFAGQQAARFGPARARNERRFNRINVVTHVDRVATIPGALERHFGNLVDTVLFNTVVRGVNDDDGGWEMNEWIGEKSSVCARAKE